MIGTDSFHGSTTSPIPRPSSGSTGASRLGANTPRPGGAKTKRTAPADPSSSIDWIEVGWPTARHNGYEDAFLPVTSFAGRELLPDGLRSARRPVLVFGYRMTDGLETVEARAFGSDRVRDASAFFHCFLVNLDAAGGCDAGDARAGGPARLWILLPDGRVSCCIHGGSLDGARVFQALAACYREATGGSLESRIRERADVTARLSRLRAKADNLTARRGSLVHPGCTDPDCRHLQGAAREEVQGLDARLREVNAEWELLVGRDEGLVNLP